MIKALRHFLTITRHRHKVISHCFKAGIFWQGLFHDISKYTPSEFITGAKYYQGGKRSPNEAERVKFGYSKAWLHHKGRNRHHFEYWTDINPATHQLTPVKMPLKYVTEMFCDRVAASKIYKGSEYNDGCPLLYFKNEKGARFINQETSDTLERWLTVLANEGEKAVFALIRKERKQG